MQINKQVATLLLASGLVVGGLGAGVLMTPSPGVSLAAPVSQGQPVNAEEDQVQEPSYVGSIPAQTKDGVNEVDEAAALQGQAKISAGDAEAAALAANPGATVVKTEMDNENGALVYSVELASGLDVKVDAGNGAILATDPSNDTELNEADDTEDAPTDAEDTDTVQNEQEDGDQDNVQEEHDGQPDDATEVGTVESTVGQ